MKRLAIVIGCAAALFGCGDSVDREVQAALQPLDGCRKVESTIREAALKEMDRRLDRALEEAFARGSHCGYGHEDLAESRSAPGGATPQNSGTAGGSSKSGGAGQWSGTNNQVQGVDEADFVKTDGKYIYIAKGSFFRVLLAWPADRTQEIAKVKIKGTALKLFVAGDRALIYSSINARASGSSGGGGVARSSAPYRRRECIYGYGCQFTGNGLPTKITVFDIRDRRAPALLRELALSASFLAARRIGKAVHTVTTLDGVRFKGLRYYPSNFTRCRTYSAWEILAAFTRLRAKNAEIIRSAKLTDWMPSIKDTIHRGGKTVVRDQLLAGCNGFYRSALNDGRQFTTVISLDISKESPPQAATIVSRPGAVYASAGALYMSVPRQRAQSAGWYRSMHESSSASTVHKFVLTDSPPAARYVASGVVKGRVLNQFAMDEYQGHLRIATSNGHVPSPDVHSTLTVLRQRGGKLEKSGVVDSFAPKEDIRSVRFAGDRGFVVTFKKTDPLFIFDLADPSAPRILAELKIPGFSTYMHMMDDTHLLTIGYDADDRGSFAWFRGVMLQIFDVSDPQRPKLAHKEVIGTRGSSSEALTNHLAFTYFAPKQILALPMTICEGGSGGGSYGTQMTFSGLMVYTVTLDKGFELRGRVPHADLKSDRRSCGTWWTNATSVVKRSIIMDDYVFSISDAALKVNRLDRLSVDLASVPLVD